MNSRRIVLTCGFTFLLLSLIRTAWLSDDSYISFRTAENLIAGAGPVWNVGERVQAFTHPLWLGLCTVAFALTGEVYYTAIALGMFVTIAGVGLLARLALTPAGLAVCFAGMLSSKAFIDYSTSGLENPLTHLLLIAFAWQWWTGAEGPVRLTRLSLFAALAMLNRMDLALIVLPPLMHAAWRLGPRAAARPLVVGFLPFVAWEALSTFYYGTPFPNTAYAKLTPVLTTAVRWHRGFNYIYRTLSGDPATLPLIVLAVVTAIAARRRTDWPLVAGIALYVTYTIGIGGDFMMGRFFTAPFVVGLAMLGRTTWLHLPRRGPLVAAGILLLGLAAPWEPAILGGFGFAYVRNRLVDEPKRAPMDELPYLTVRQITDERRYYYEGFGLLKVIGRGSPDHEWRSDGLDLRAHGRQTVVRNSIGFVGYYAGPEVYIIDSRGLADPLLARLPGGTAESTIGHLDRPIPDGYLKTVATGTNHIADPNLAAYYEKLHEVVSGDLWSGHRLVTLVAFVFGRYDHFLHAYLARREP